MPQTKAEISRTYTIARCLMTDYGINIYEDKIKWEKLESFCSHWSKENSQNSTYFSNAVFLFANKIQRGEI